MLASVFTLLRWDAMSLFSPAPDRLVHVHRLVTRVVQRRVAGAVA